jgi:hypothetical protein
MNNVQVIRKGNRTSDPVKVLGILRLVFGLLALALLLASLSIFVIGNLRVANWSQTEGTVTSLRYQRPNSSAVAPVIDYSVNGVKYTHNSNVYSSFSSYKVGDKLTIFYDPSNPQTSELNDNRLDQLLSLIFGINGVVWLLITGILWIIRANLLRKRRRQF